MPREGEIDLAEIVALPALQDQSGAAARDSDRKEKRGVRWRRKIGENRIPLGFGTVAAQLDHLSADDALHHGIGRPAPPDQVVHGGRRAKEAVAVLFQDDRLILGEDLVQRVDQLGKRVAVVVGLQQCAQDAQICARTIRPGPTVLRGLGGARFNLQRGHLAYQALNIVAKRLGICCRPARLADEFALTNIYL